MKLGVFEVLFAGSGMKFEDALDYIAKAGVKALELGTGGYSNKAHCDPDVLLNDEDAFKKFREAIESRDLEISALSCHGNPVHPQKEIADKYHEAFEKTVLLAEKLGLNRIVTFSGCPGDSENSKYPNWVTCPWPDDFLKILDYQWNEKLIPYWEKAVKFANDHGVTKIALEMHPGFCVYNPETLLKLRNAVGPTIGANFDPSHLFWQGVDPVYAIRELGDAIYFFHAKDTRIDEINAKTYGVLDTKHYSDEIHRSWIFRSIGYGHDYQVWKDIISNLRMVGYDDVLSIEHEDSLLSANEGFQKAVSFLKEVLAAEPLGAMWWA